MWFSASCAKRLHLIKRTEVPVTVDARPPEVTTKGHLNLRNPALIKFTLWSIRFAQVLLAGNNDFWQCVAAATLRPKALEDYAQMQMARKIFRFRAVPFGTHHSTTEQFSRCWRWLFQPRCQWSPRPGPPRSCASIYSTPEDWLPSHRHWHSKPCSPSFMEEALIGRRSEGRNFECSDPGGPSSALPDGLTSPDVSNPGHGIRDP